MLIAISTWASSMPLVRTSLNLRGDALGVLQVVMARRAKSPVINKIIAEIQLLLGGTMFDLYLADVWSEKNEVADKLSRVPQGEEVPECCTGEPSPAIRRQWKFLQSPPSRKLQRPQAHSCVKEDIVNA